LRKIAILKKSALVLPLITLTSGMLMIGLLTVGFLIIQLNTQLPNAQSIRDVELKIPLRVYSADKLLISEFGNERRKPLEYGNFPKTLIDAVLSSEDAGFFEHSGIDFSGLIRAALSNFRSGQTQQGASTITMQVARNFFLSPEKTYFRKVKEILLALRLEQILSKQEILSLYLNKIFLGHRSYGFGAAAEVYYGKELSELSVAEIAMLAGLPKAPSRYNPLRNAERAVIRRNYVLKRMSKLGKISDDAYQLATSAPTTAEKHTRSTGLVAPHIAEMVRSHLTEAFGEGAYWQGLNVYTTIQSKQQLAADAALRVGLKAYDRRHGFRGPIAKLILSELPVDEELGGIDYDNVLSVYPSSQEQQPAIITEVSEQQAVAQTRTYGAVKLDLADAQWAKRHRTANLVGDPPRSMSDILSTGDVVYIEPINENPEITENTQVEREQVTFTDPSGELQMQWKLSQIPNVGGALISMQPNTGKIISLVGGYDFFLNKYNRAVQSIRQPGSNIKPFIYSASLDKGFTPATLISGAPIVTRDPVHGTVWRPENYSGKFFGPTRMREALGKSLNLVSIRLLRSIGIPYAREYTARFGIDMDRFSPTLTMALGAGGATPLQVVNAYSTLANGGYQVQPQFIDYITDRAGQVIYRADQPEFCDQCYVEHLANIEELKEESLEDDQPALEQETMAEQETIAEQETMAEQEAATIEEPIMADQQVSAHTKQEPNLTNDEPSSKDAPLSDAQILAASLSGVDLPDKLVDAEQRYYSAPRVMNSANNFLTVSMLKDVVRRGTARKALKLNRQDLAGKTGTTNDYIDAWFSGFNSKVATTVWVGFDNPSTMGRGEAGSKAALPIWVDYMRTGLKGIPEDEQQTPAYIEETFINKVTGKRTDEFDPDAISEYFAIDELVPEFISPEAQQALLEKQAAEQKLADQALSEFNKLSPEQQALQRQLEQEALRQERENAELQSLLRREQEALGLDQGFDDKFNDNGQLTEPSLLDPQDRIIEQEQDTEGLF